MSNPLDDAETYAEMDRQQEREWGPGKDKRQKIEEAAHSAEPTCPRCQRAMTLDSVHAFGSWHCGRCAIWYHREKMNS